jgi:hypothetical protein
MTFSIRFETFKSGGNPPGFERAYLGGYGFSDAASYRFVGYERDEFAVPDTTIAGVGYRHQLFMRPLGFIGKGYLSVEYNLARMDDTADGRAAFGHVVHGGAMGLDFDTMIGPMRFAAGIGESAKPKIYISLGPSF